MKASRLGLIGAALGIVAAWGCASFDEAGADVSPRGGAGGDLSTAFGSDGDLRIDPPGAGIEALSDAAGGGGLGPGSSSSGTAGIFDAGASPPICSYPPIGDIHLSLPSGRPLASAALARGFIEAGQAPNPAIVHPKEFLNYYPPAYDGSSQDISAVSDVARGDLPNEIILQIGVRAPSSYQHRPLALAVVVDTSLSMAGEGILRARAALKALASALRPGDRITVLTSSMTDVPVFIPVVDDGNTGKVVAVADALEADGGDLLGAALAEAYLAVAHERALTGLGRVLLVTDGAARADQIDLGIVAGNYQLADIPLIGVGVADATTYDTSLVDTASRIGGGTSVYLDSADEAATVLGTRFDEIMDIGAREVQVKLTLPSYLRLKGVQTSDATGSLTGLSRSDLPLGRALVFRHVLETCGDVAALPPTTIPVSVRWKPREGGEFVDYRPADATFDVTSLTVAPQIIKTSLVLGYAEALANVRTAQLYTVAKAIEQLQTAGTPPELAADDDLDEIKQLAQQFVAAANAP